MRELRIVFSKKAAKQAIRLPPQTADKLERWQAFVTLVGLQESRLHPGFHDEGVTGQPGLRSIRLSLQYRLFYRVALDGQVQLVSNEAITAHDYRKR